MAIDDATPEEGSRHARQEIRTERDAVVAGRDQYITYGGRSDTQPQPGIFSLRPPYGRLPPAIRGRDSLLAKLTNELDRPRPAVQILTGLGGCGKTAVALAVASRVAADGWSVWWVSAADSATATSAFRQLAVDLGVDLRMVEAAWKGELSAPDLLWRHLWGRRDRWLLVVDEVDDPMLLAVPGGLPCDGTGWVRCSDRGAVLITTRDSNQSIWQDAILHPIRELDIQQASEVLLDWVSPLLNRVEGREPRLARPAYTVADTLGGLPLALRLAGSFFQTQLRRELRRTSPDVDPISAAIRVMDDYEEAVRCDVTILDQGADIGGRWVSVLNGGAADPAPALGLS